MSSSIDMDKDRCNRPKGARLFAKLHDENDHFSTGKSVDNRLFSHAGTYLLFNASHRCRCVVCSEYPSRGALSCSAQGTLDLPRGISLFNRAELVQYAVLYAHYVPDSE
ncbi:hypothetical protein D3C73_1198970 [compost metagenome]